MSNYPEGTRWFKAPWIEPNDTIDVCDCCGDEVEEKELTRLFCTIFICTKCEEDITN